MKFFRLRTPWRFAEPPALQIDSFQRVSANQVMLTFTASANLAYAVEHRSNLTTGVWNSVTNFPAAGTNRLIEVTLPSAAESGFYRLRSP
jgi:hypothetical protein